MRSFTPQVETREIADADLDSVAGGIAISGGATTGLVGLSGGVSIDGLEETLGAVAPALSIPQIAGGVTL
ncbi:MAG: hypothetical protein QOF84_5218 [Streptomyces sp.]|jgi:hypothetical protein|nr:hypothetical protein [Streptomyces sp.]